MEGYFLYVAKSLDDIRLGGGPSKFDIIGEFKSWSFWRAVLAELVATMLFVFVGTMAAVNSDNTDMSSKVLQIGLTFGIMIAVCIQMIGHVSGGHMNPAVSIAMAVTLNISPTRALLYTVAQCVGGIFGSLLLKGVSPDIYHDNLGVTSVSETITAGQGFGVEVVLTFILVLSICGCTDPNRPFFGSPALGIGLTVGVCHLAGIPFTGSSLNPARSLASAVVSEKFDDHWVYWIGPILGGCAAAICYKFVFDPYRGVPSYSEAVDRLIQSNDAVILPRGNLKSASNGRDTKVGMDSTSHL